MAAYVPVGPKSPIAGPTLAIEAIEQPKASLVDKPVAIKIMVDAIKVIIKIDIKTGCENQ